MNAVSVQPVVDLRKFRRAVRSPKGNLVLVLGAIAVIALTTEDASHAIPTVMNAVGAATLADGVAQCSSEVALERYNQLRLLTHGAYAAGAVLAVTGVGLGFVPLEGGGLVSAELRF